MNFRLYLTMALFLALLIESTFSFFPLVLIFSYLLFFIWENFRVFLIIFIATFILDSLRVVNFGVTPLFLFTSLLVLLLYRKTFTLQDPRIIFALILIFGIIYSVIVGYGTNIIFSIILLIAFSISFKYFQTKNFTFSLMKKKN